MVHLLIGNRRGMYTDSKSMPGEQCDTVSMSCDEVYSMGKKSQGHY